MFNTIDYVVIAVYILGLVSLGFYLQKKASASLEDYFLGGNKLPWWALGISGMASQLDMTGTMILVSMLFMFGMSGMYIEVRGGLALLMAFAMVFMGKYNRRSGCMTVAEWMEYRFGSGRAGQAARTIQAVGLLISTVGILAYFVKGSGLFLSMFLPYSPFTCAIIMVIIATIYTVVSGFYGVVFTDIFQAGFILAATAYVSVKAFTSFGDNTELGVIVERIVGNTQWMSSSFPLKADMPAGYEMFDKFALAVMFYIILAVFMGMSRSGGRPNYFGARSERECGTQTFVWLISSSIRWPMIIGFVILGIILIGSMFPDMEMVAQTTDIIKQVNPDVEQHNWSEYISSIRADAEAVSPGLSKELEFKLGNDWKEKISLISYHGTVNSEQVLPAVILHSIPSGLKGLIIIALIAAAMSTFDSTVNMAAAYFVRDIYQRHLNKDADTKKLVRVSHITCVVLVAGGVILGYYARSINDIWGWIMAGLGGGMALPGLMRWYWWRFNGEGYTLGVFFGLLAAILQRAIFPDALVWHSFPLIITISFIGAIIGTYLFKPADEKVLRNFYNSTRPFGLWGKYLGMQETKWMQKIKREHKNDIISLFFAVPWQFLLYWLPVQIILKNWQVFWVSSIFFAISSVGLYWFWYRNLDNMTSDNTKSMERV